MGKCENLSSKITNYISNEFFKLGFFVASNPWKIIIGSFLILGICCSGFFKFSIEQDPLELWIPQDSTFLKTTKWLLNNLDIGYRVQSVLITAPNVLEPKIIRKILKIHNKINAINGQLKNGTVVDWNNICFRIPFISEALHQTLNRRRRSIDDNDPFGELFEEADSLKKTPKREFNPSVDLDPRLYCKFINKLPWGCYEKNFADLWKYNEEEMRSLTLAEVQIKLRNDSIVSPITGHETNYRELLGGIELDENNHIIGAKAVLIQWYVNLNMSDVNSQRRGNLAGTQDWITEEASVWENAFLQKIEELQKEMNNGEEFQLFYAAAKSFGDISYKTMFQETDKLVVGIIIMFTYIQIVLSKFSCVDFRFTLGSAGLLSVGLAFVSACGICSMINIPYGPVHTSLPFLLMGLGVDDMFVFMACWRKVQHDKEFSIEEKIGKMLKHAGQSITVTSLTDVIAFSVGSLTVIPSLQSFCLYAAVGVLMTYFYAITFYLAIFTLDEYRIAANRNTVFPCYIHKNEENKRKSCDLNLMNKSLNFIYGKFILTKAGKILILLAVIVLSGISTKNLLKLEQKFDPMWFIPESTYLSKYIQNSRYYYPDSGYAGSIFMGKLNYTNILPKLANLTKEIENEDEMYKDISSWVKPFFHFTKTYYYRDLFKETLKDDEWKFYLSKFLFSPKGGKYQGNFRFKKPLKCGELTSDVTISWIDFRFKKFSHRDDYIPAMKKLDKLLEQKELRKSGDGFAEVWSRAYGNWITDEIIDREVYRNIVLALVCVMFCTYVVIINLQVCFWIFICVLLTLVNVGGFMQVWGLTIDLVSCIGLQLAVGLCVDYAAHIGHTFLVCSNGDRNKRVLDTVLHIGAAVLHGGGSTLLPLTLLSKSDAYTFQSFFKIFLLVILFGLFHGVVLLPVILSIIGPKPYIKINSNEDSGGEEEMQSINLSKNTKAQKTNSNIYKDPATMNLNDDD